MDAAFSMMHAFRKWLIWPHGRLVGSMTEAFCPSCLPDPMVQRVKVWRTISESLAWILYYSDFEMKRGNFLRPILDFDKTWYNTYKWHKIQIMAHPLSVDSKEFVGFPQTGCMILAERAGFPDMPDKETLRSGNGFLGKVCCSSYDDEKRCIR